MSGTRFSLEVQPVIPERLHGLEEIANDLLYSWDREVRRLFIRLDSALWERVGHNPKVFLRRVSQHRLDDAAEDRNYMEDYVRALSAYNAYHREKLDYGMDKHLAPGKDLVAYFCAEFGFHESMPIYSGGLGILAGDHCKAASDLVIPFVAIGMLYRKGYFTQTIDVHGRQLANYASIDFTELPIRPALDGDGNAIKIYVELPGRIVKLNVWIAKAGHIQLILLDSDLEENSESDRSITYQLYGGDSTTRIQQEIVLGIGGVRALRALNLVPSVWHINEGHSAFQILERSSELMNRGYDLQEALELVASGTVFTTHTPVPAGHDMFDHDLLMEYLKDYINTTKIGKSDLFRLGAHPNKPNSFNMTALALRGSRFHNGVSQIHGGVASGMERYIWPQIPPDENPIQSVTNGVHVPTFLAKGWANLFDMQFGREWRNEMLNEVYWERIDDIPDHSYWSQHQSLKADLVEEVRRRAILQHRRNGSSEALIERMVKHLSSQETDLLIIGFARRFATYKRASLIFADIERIAKILNDTKRPVLLIFAGKAHPNDIPGQQLIQVINEYSRRPEFEGKVILIEGYDLALARYLVTGVDVWLNTPTYPLEASGTSGQKAGINGVLNLSVLDGWWGEGYNGENGWGITPHGPQFDENYRNQEEAKDLLNILENQVIPLYYTRNGHGFSEKWVKMSKSSMKSLIPRFNAQRMVRDYVAEYYGPAAKNYARMVLEDGHNAKELAAWKKKIHDAWSNVTISSVDQPRKQIKAGESLPLKVCVSLGTLQPKDVKVECLIGKTNEADEFLVRDEYELNPTNTDSSGNTYFELDLHTPLSGIQYYKIRVYPYNNLLANPFEMGCMIWL